MLNKSKDEGQALPRIQSQKRVNTVLQRASSRENLEKKGDPSNRQLKRTLSSANTCRAVRYENTGVIYSKKIADLILKRKALDSEIKNIEEEINTLKKMSSNHRFSNMARERDEHKPHFITETTQPVESKISSKSKIGTDEKWLNSQIKLAENKLSLMRKKIDQQLQKNNKVRKEVDIVRKQVHTLKNLSKNIQAALKQTNEQYQHYNDLSKRLDEEIGQKNEQMHKTKIQNQHKKAEKIRQFNEILKCLEKDLQEQKNNRKQQSINDGEPLYMTEFFHLYTNKEVNQKEPLKGALKQSSLRKSKSGVNIQISNLRAKLQNYEKQFEQIRQKTGLKTTDQIIKKFYQKYEQNFKYYNYINDLHATLQEIQKQNIELKKVKQEKQAEILKSLSTAKEQEIFNLKSSLSSIKEEKSKYSTLVNNYEKKLSSLKKTIIKFYSKVDMKDSIDEENLSEENVKVCLEAIRNRCLQLDARFEKEAEKTQSSSQYNLQQLLESAKKSSNLENSDPRSQSLMTREDFIKARDNFLRKKPTPRKPLSKR